MRLKDMAAIPGGRRILIIELGKHAQRTKRTAIFKTETGRRKIFGGGGGGERGFRKDRPFPSPLNLIMKPRRCTKLFI